ncbi:hypothetical protein HPP92_027187 [Vanilla planifolia]|uniref:OVATE domain-containing protein n=1 Tax=Vanilla planifolia TaxID=51239 RepID=A0A835PAT8_VANPL|nr:hypothetical protein HPP92_027187 [Vanilla planifolia]
MVQERLARLIEEQQWSGRGRTGDGKLIVLVAMDKHSYEPRMDFMQSMMDVITTKGLKEPTELRNLLNCYIKMNPSEQRQAILEAFHEQLPIAASPVHLAKLTIIKLDASSFDVHVARTASVRELKIAVEDVFTQSKKDGPRRPSPGLKLIEEKALLKNFGIKDGDQLHFIRHLSISYTPLRHRQRLHPAKTELRRKSWSGPEHLDLEFEDSTSDKIRNGVLTTVIDDGEDEHLVVVDQQYPFKLTQYLKGWLCYSVPKDACRRARLLEQ